MSKVYNCSCCNKEFKKDRKAYNSDAVFCSKDCMAKHMSKLYKGKKPVCAVKRGIYYKCDNCGKECYDCKSGYNRNENHFCGEECQVKYCRGENHHVVQKSIYHDVSCPICDKKFTIINSRYRENGNYCSKECQWISQRGEFYDQQDERLSREYCN